MPKNQFINPETLLKKGKISFKDICVNSYDENLSHELEEYGTDGLFNMYRDMRAIREFETVIGCINTPYGYHGTRLNYNGPAHLAIGQEAAAVGQAYHLTRNDFIFGSHRAHAELLARGLRSAATFTENELLEIMRGLNGGKNLALLERKFSFDNVRELAEYFLYYSALAEVFSKENGFQRGLAGGMHMFFTPFGVYPNNAIVGAQVPIGVGAALFKAVNDTDGLVIVNAGDGATGCGVIYESMNFAAMDQLKKLWNYGKGLPIIFAFSDNGYGMGGQTCGETMAYGSLARIGAQVNPEAMYAERINGNNVTAVADAYKRKFQGVKNGETPVLLDVVTYRLDGHSGSDKMSYRVYDEIAAWKKFDPIESFKNKLVSGGAVSEDVFCEAEYKITESMKNIAKLAVSEEDSPTAEALLVSNKLKELVFSNGQNITAKTDKMPPKELSPRVAELRKLKRRGIDESGKLISSTDVVTMRDALFEALLDRFYEDSKLIAYGEDVRDWGGISGEYSGLTELLPYDRFFNAPISEAAIVSTAIGYAISGGRAIVDIMFADFTARAADEIINQLAKWRTMSAGELKLPVVIKITVGDKYGTQHSQDFTALFSHIPGLKIVYPATPYDAKGLLTEALCGDDPVLFFGSRKLVKKTELFNAKGVPEHSYRIPIGEPDIKISGTDITILTIGTALYKCVDAAEKVKSCGISAEVIDMRSVVPFNYDAVIESVKKTGRILLVTDDNTRGSVMSEVVRVVTERAFSFLNKPPVVLGAKDTVIPPSALSGNYYPTTEEIIQNIMILI